MTSDPVRPQRPADALSGSSEAEPDGRVPGAGGSSTQGLDPRAKELFAEAIEKPEAERADFLSRSCPDPALRAEVEALLCAHELCERTFRTAGKESLAEQAGQVIGNYRLLQEIGAGGFGVVWMAEQLEPVRRKVALKILKLGMDTRQVVARFEAERQALALMDHPNIAKVFEAGATERGRPYFVMELVRGEPITRYCDRAGLTIGARLRLFHQVCQAVQHAHTKGIIHRDLKPGNVMVTLHDGTPVPKVIDFGIAKAIHRELTTKTLFTEFRQMLGTPEYMAPEQAELSGLDIDTRADVYSLGVLLYELLTGRRPFELEEAVPTGCEELLRRIKEEDPPRPSTRASTLGRALAEAARTRSVHPKTLPKLLRNDLDWMVMKALEKERGRRYETAAAFAEDVQRYLEDRPVHAGPPSRLHQLTKYLRRHRVGATAVTAVLLSLLVGLGVALVSYFDAREKEHLAVTQAKRAETVVALMVKMLGSSDPHEVKGENYTIGRLLEDFDRERDALKDEPEVEATLRRTIGLAYLGLGLPRKAEPHLRSALETRRNVLGEDSPAVAESLHDWTQYLHAQGDYRGAEASARRALTMFERLTPDNASTIANALDALADNLRHLARYEEALATASRALDIRARRSGATPPSDVLAMILFEKGDVARAEQVVRDAIAIKESNHRDRSEIAMSHGILASILVEKGDLRGAEEHATEAYSIQRAILGDGHPTVSGCLGSLASVRIEMGDLDAAERLHEKALAIHRAAFGASHPMIAMSLSNLGGVLRKKGDYAGAERRHREALEILEECYDGEHPQVAETLISLATAVGANGRFQDAEALANRALAMQARLLGEGHPAIAGSHHSLAQHLAAREDFKGAERHLRAALAIYGRFGQQGHPKSARSLRELGQVLLAEGDPVAAERSVRAAMEVFRNLSCTEGPDYAKVLSCLGEILMAKRDLRGAEEAHSQALALREKLFGTGHSAFADSLNHLATVLMAKGDLDGAEKRFREALDIDRKLHQEAHPNLAAALHNLGAVLEANHKLEEAEDLLRQALAMAKRCFPGDNRRVAVALHNLGHLVLNRGKDLAEAEDLLRQALRMSRACYGDAHAAVATNLHNLGRALVARGNLDEAVKSFQRALALRRELVGNDSRDVANTLEWLGNTLRLKGDFAGAAERLEESLATTLRILGDRDPAVAALFLNLVAALESKRDQDGLQKVFLAAPAGVVEALRKKLATQARVLGDEHPDVTTAILLLASVLKAKKDLDGAEKVLRAAPAMQRDVLGDKHAEVVHKLGHIMGDDRGDARSAMDLFRKSLEIRRASGLPEDATAAEYLRCLARAASADRVAELELAETSYRGAVAILRRLAPGSKDLANRLAELGLLLLRREKCTEAEPVLRDALEIRKDKGPEHWTYANTKSMLGGALLGQGRFADAEQLLIEGYEQMAESLRRLRAQKEPPDPRDVASRLPRIREALERLVSLYGKSGRPEMADSWRAKLALVLQEEGMVR